MYGWINVSLRWIDGWIEGWMEKCKLEMVFVVSKMYGWINVSFG